MFSNTGASRQQTRIQNILLHWKFIRFRCTFFVVCVQLVRPMEFPLYVGPLNTSLKFLCRLPVALVSKCYLDSECIDLNTVRSQTLISFHFLML